MSKQNVNFRMSQTGLDLDDLFIRRKLFTRGGLWLSGDNTYGQIGDNTTTFRSSLVQTISGGTNWKEISCGDIHVAAIKTDGTLWTWGGNEYGGLGNNQNGNGEFIPTNSKSSPVQTVSGGTNWRYVSSRGYYTAAIKTDGTLWLWGSNFWGELGNNENGGGSFTITNSKSSPVQTVAGGTNWKSVSTSSSSIFLFHTAAIKTDGTLWLWGNNALGQLGDNTSTDRSSPVQTVSGGTNWKQVSVGGCYTAAIKTDGTLWLWGQNDVDGGGYPTSGQLGDNTTIIRSSPVQTVSGGSNWKEVSCGHYHTAAIKTDGTLWLWGSDQSGQLGDNTTTDKSSPVQTVSGGTNWKSVVCNGYATAAIKTDGTLWQWGDIVPASSPVQITGGGTEWKSVILGWGNFVAIRENN